AVATRRQVAGIADAVLVGIRLVGVGGIGTVVLVIGHAIVVAIIDRGRGHDQRRLTGRARGAVGVGGAASGWVADAAGTCCIDAARATPGAGPARAGAAKAGRAGGTGDARRRRAQHAAIVDTGLTSAAFAVGRAGSGQIGDAAGTLRVGGAGAAPARAG